MIHLMAITVGICGVISLVCAFTEYRKKANLKGEALSAIGIAYLMLSVWEWRTQ